MKGKFRMTKLWKFRLLLIMFIFIFIGCSASTPTKISRFEEDPWEVLGVEELSGIGRIIVEYKIGENDPYLMSLISDGTVKKGTWCFRVINKCSVINHVKINFEGKGYLSHVKEGWIEMYPFEIYNLGYFEPEGNFFWLIDAHVKITEILIKELEL